MAKLDSLFKYDGTFQGVTVVNSRAYGQHIRKARTTFTLNKKMKESSAVLGKANGYARVFKDAIDPYRRDFRDGQLWQRLVSVFKKQIQEKGSADFSCLEKVELNKIHPFSRAFTEETTVSQSGKTLNIEVKSNYSKDPTGGRADGYQQIIIVVFTDDNLQVKTFSESTYLPLKGDQREQRADFSIPDGATSAIIVVKCIFSLHNEPMGLQKGMGMRVVGVVRVVG